MKVYNTLTRRVEEFVPNVEGKVSMYTCGPTVYHFANIGNLRSYIREDVLEKSFRYAGYDVKRVIEALKKFEGNFVLQTCMLRGNGFDSSSPEVVGPMMDIVRLLKPREWMVYTIDRATPMQGLEKFSPQEMKALVKPVIDEGFTKVQIKGAVEDN